MKPLIFWLFIATAVVVMAGLVIFALSSTKVHHMVCAHPKIPIATTCVASATAIIG